MEAPGAPIIQGLGISIMQMFSQAGQVLPGKVPGGEILREGVLLPATGEGHGAQGEAAGRIAAQLLKPEGFSPMTEQDFSQALMEMKQPATTGNLTLANGMVRSGVPLNLDNLITLQAALSRVPEKSPMDTAAACYLKANSLPLTPQNITLLAQFFAAHPLIGAQLFELNESLRRMNRGEEGKSFSGLDELPALLGKYILDPSQTSQELEKALGRMARMAGVEAGEGKEQFETALLRLQAGLSSEKGAEEFSGLLGKVISNIQAQQLLNQARPQEGLGYYYMQMPVRMDEETPTLEFKVRYRVEDGGARIVQTEDTAFEFEIEMEYLGRLRVKGEIVKGSVELEIETETQQVEEFIRRFIPALEEGIRNLGYWIGQIRTRSLEEDTREIFTEEKPLERVDMEI
ncbi:MAG: activator of Hsp90 ATPase N-terminal domain-containing protein [Chloroflexi bacterium]|nr:activator of Hsp90 ATPase N-terminal domain-containing protein [Chloroflexota bacterium]